MREYTSNVIPLFGNAPTPALPTPTSQELINTTRRYASTYADNLATMAQETHDEKLPQGGLPFEKSDADAMEAAVDRYIADQLSEAIATSAILRYVFKRTHPGLLRDTDE